MRKILKKLLWPLSFTLGGALAGLGYYHLIGCVSGACPITSSPLNSMLYMAIFGWLVSQILKKEPDSVCSM